MHFKRLSSVVVCLCLSVLYTAAASAATKTWTGAASNLWSNAGNWTGGVPASGDALVFPNDAVQTTIVNDLAAGLIIDTITFVNVFPNPGGFNISGNAITLMNGVSGQTATPSNWAVPTTLGASQTFNTLGTFSSTINLNGFTLTVSEATIAGPISGNGNVLFAGNAVHLTGSINISGSVESQPLSFCAIDLDGPVTATQLIVAGMPVAPPSLTGTGTFPPTTITNTMFRPDDNIIAGNLVANAGWFSHDLTPSDVNSVTVNGNVTLNNPTLFIFFPGALPTAGSSFVIIDNDGADAVSGTFNGLPEGAQFGHSGVLLQISYAGGTGNDVVLTVVTSQKSWTGAVNNLWSVGGNWVDGVAPVDGDELVFPAGASNQTNTNDIAGLDLESVAFPSDTTNYSISGNAITLSNGITKHASSGVVTWNVPTTLTASQTFSVGSSFTFLNTTALNGHTLTLNGYTPALNGSITGTGNFDVQSGGRVLSPGPINITGNVTMGPAGRWNATGTIAANQFTVNALNAFPSVLAGTGTFPPVTTNFTTIQPGDDPTAFCCVDPHVIGTMTTGSLTVNNYGISYDLTTPSSDRVVVNGSVTLNNASLGLTFPSGDPAPGTTFTLIQNDGADAVIGTFVGHPEGSAFQLGALWLRITYAGGTGNDVVLTVLFPTTMVLAQSTPTTVTGESFELTATVSASSGTPTGEVTFERNGVFLGSATLDPSGQAVLTTSLQAGTDSIVAIYASEGVFAPSESAPLTHTTTPASTSVEVTTVPNPSYGQNAVDAVVQVSPVAPGTGVPSGDVSVSVDGVFVATATLDSAGQATIALPAMTYGTHTIRAEYEGDTNYLASSDEAQHEVAHAEIPTLSGWMLILLAGAMAFVGGRLALR